MNITKDQASLLGRKTLQPIKQPGELLAVWIPGAIRNPSNGSYVHWSKHRKWARDWKERVALALLEDSWHMEPAAMRVHSRMPKRVAFLANVHTLFDDDNLQSALKPVRDGLVDAGVISGDGPRDGHEFLYAQQVNRQQRGVTIRVSLRSAP